MPDVSPEIRALIERAKESGMTEEQGQALLGDLLLAAFTGQTRIMELAYRGILHEKGWIP